MSGSQDVSWWLEKKHKDLFFISPLETETSIQNCSSAILPNSRQMVFSRFSSVLTSSIRSTWGTERDERGCAGKRFLTSHRVMRLEGKKSTTPADDGGAQTAWLTRRVLMKARVQLRMQITAIRRHAGRWPAERETSPTQWPLFKGNKKKKHLSWGGFSRICCCCCDYFQQQQKQQQLRPQWTTLQ